VTDANGAVIFVWEKIGGRVDIIDLGVWAGGLGVDCNDGAACS
jgi:hypothetical protein